MLGRHHEGLQAPGLSEHVLRKIQGVVQHRQAAPAALQLAPGHQEARRQWRLQWRQQVLSSVRGRASAAPMPIEGCWRLSTPAAPAHNSQQQRVSAVRQPVQRMTARPPAPLCPQAVSSAPADYTERKKKPPGEVIRYSRDFLMKFVQVGMAAAPPGCQRHARNPSNQAAWQQYPASLYLLRMAWAFYARSMCQRWAGRRAALFTPCCLPQALHQAAAPRPPATRPPRPAEVHTGAPGAAVQQQRHPAGCRRPRARAAAAAAAACGGRRGGRARLALAVGAAARFRRRAAAAAARQAAGGRRSSGQQRSGACARCRRRRRRGCQDPKGGRPGPHGVARRRDR